MEVLNLIIKRRINEAGDFTYHAMCKDQNITHLCFADDLILFCHGDKESARVIKDSLTEFSEVSGLFPNDSKSEAFYCRVESREKSAISDIIRFSEGSLPVKYLGVPLITTRLYSKDCKGLINKVKTKLNDWKNKSLSFAGRLQLILSVLSSMQIYWASIFILPSSISQEIEKLMRGFLWCQGELKRGKAKVSWKAVCLPKSQGGLGIKNLTTWNVALMATHTWRLLNKKDSLWVKWIHSYRLKGRNFWDVPIRGNIGWGWRHILRMRSIIRPFLIHQIGDGGSASAWFDNWHPGGPLCKLISPRSIARAGFSIDARVKDIILNGSWASTHLWYSTHLHILGHTPPPLNPNLPDKLVWRNRDGISLPYSVHEVWLSIRQIEPEVPWHHMVWFSQNIPRHAFVLWVSLRDRLKTHDKLKFWETRMDLKCAFCNSVPDSHHHLFFECSFPSKVWHLLKPKMNLPNCPDNWVDATTHLQQVTKGKSMWAIIRRLVFAGTIYHLWRERNNRIFKKQGRQVDAVVKTIYEDVRTRLIGLKIKDNPNTRNACDVWDIPKGILLQPHKRPP